MIAASMLHDPPTSRRPVDEPLGHEAQGRDRNGWHQWDRSQRGDRDGSGWGAGGGGRPTEEERAVLVGEIEAAGGQARFVRTDVANEADIARLAGIATSSHGRLDFAFNNAGIELSGSIETVTHSNFRRVFDINVWGIAAAMKYEVAAVLSSGGGAIVNTSTSRAMSGLPISAFTTRASTPSRV
jgi:NAD(P)-dependent dehydrogenase (short-subunit alcohol dehydrogenase family)